MIQCHHNLILSQPEIIIHKKDKLNSLPNHNYLPSNVLFFPFIPVDTCCYHVMENHHWNKSIDKFKINGPDFLVIDQK